MHFVDKNFDAGKKRKRVMVRALFGFCMLAQLTAFANDNLLPIEKGQERDVGVQILLIP